MTEPADRGGASDGLRAELPSIHDALPRFADALSGYLSSLDSLPGIDRKTHELVRLACTTGLPGVCGAGTTACAGGTIVCNQNVQATAEACDGEDDDCDGVIDNGDPGGGQACSTGNPGTFAKLDAVSQ